MLTIKQASPLANPANQNGSRIFGFFIKGLWNGTSPGKADLNSSDKPKFRDALITTILCNPSIVKCSLRSINSTTFLNNIKSAFFWVIKGNLSKCGIITLIKSCKEATR
jgi:hypothetical protein